MRLIRLFPLLLTRFRKEVLMLWHVMTHRATPLSAKLIALLAVIYVISPVDLIPDFILVLGWLDDIGVVALLLTIAYKFLPQDLYDLLREKVHGQRAAPVPASGRNKREPVTIDVSPER
jgi:uncharacterized membrane protein YkvA (DUF1232 family)